MKERKQILFLSFLLFASCEKGSNQVEKDVISISTEIAETEKSKGADEALAFVNAYIDRDFESGNIVDWAESNDMTTEFFRSELKNIIDKANREDAEMGLGFDPILNAQDLSDKGFVLDRFDDENNCVHLKGKDQEQFKITVKMIRKDNKWLVDGCCEGLMYNDLLLLIFIIKQYRV